MDGGAGDIILSKDFLYFIRSVFGLGKDDSVFDIGILQKMDEEILFVFFADSIE
jgi:hypothetical protein